jgi:uncharacterized protein YjdB
VINRFTAVTVARVMHRRGGIGSWEAPISSAGEAAMPRRGRRASAAGVALVVAAAFLLLSGVARASVVTKTFSTAGCSLWTVPAGVASVSGYAVGAAGDTGGTTLLGLSGGTGGKGDAVSGTISTPTAGPLEVCVDYEGAIGGSLGAGGADAGGGGGDSLVAWNEAPDGVNPNTDPAGVPGLVAGGGGGGGVGGGDGFVTGNGGNAGDPTGGQGTPFGSLGGAGGSVSPQPNATNVTAPAPGEALVYGQYGQPGAGAALSGAGGGGGAGFYGGYGGGYQSGDGAAGDGGGGGGADRCENTAYTSCTKVDSGAGTVHGAGTAPGDAEVVLSYDLPDPTITITTPANGASYALDQGVTENFSCSDPSGITSCSNQVEESSGATLPTFLAGTYSLTVTAKATDGSVATKTVTYSVAVPTESVTTPVAGATYLQGQSVPSSFSCADGAGALGLVTNGCVDQNGNPSGTAIDTSTPGTYTYSVTATSKDGASTSSTVTYYVAQIGVLAPKRSGDSVYTLGEPIGGDFFCTFSFVGQLGSCVDASGNVSGLSVVDTSTAGEHTFKVFASVDGGQPAEVDVPYDVQATQTISWPAQGPVTYGQLPDVLPYGPAVTLAATASSGLPVKYSVVSGPCTVTDFFAVEWLMTASGAGSCVIDADQAGDGVNYSAAPTVQQTITIDQAVMHVDANSVSTPYGTPPTLGYTLRASDFVNGDKPASIGLTGSPVCTSSAGSSPSVGTYPGAITCDPAGMSSPNYAFVAGNSGALTVTAAALESIQLTPSPGSVPAGETVAFTATGTYSDGSTAPLTSGVSWSESSGGTVASIDPSSGVATGVATGTDTMTATDGSISGQAQLTVTAPVLTGLAVNPTSLSLAKGATGPLKVTGAYSDGTSADLTGTVTWSSSNTAVATVSAGIVTAVGTGTATITATDGSESAHAQVTVTDSLAQLVVFTSTQPSGATVGGSYAVSAIGGLSGSPVVFSIDSSSTAGACSVSGASVSFTGTGTCRIDANQAGGNGYAPAPQVGQSFTIAAAPGTGTPTPTPQPSKVVHDATAFKIVSIARHHRELVVVIKVTGSGELAVLATHAIGTIKHDLLVPGASRYAFAYTTRSVAAAGRVSVKISPSAFGLALLGDSRLPHHHHPRLSIAVLFRAPDGGTSFQRKPFLW